MTQRSRTTDEILQTPVESDGFIDAVLQLAEDTVEGPRDRRQPSRSEVAVDMVDGEVLAPLPDESGDVIVDLTDDAQSVGRPTTPPVAKAKSRSAATAKANRPPVPEALAPEAPAPEELPLEEPAPEAKKLEAQPKPRQAAPPKRQAAQPKRVASAPPLVEPQRSVTPVVDFRRVAGEPAPVKRRTRPIRRLRRAFREYMIRRSSGASRVPLQKRWRNARLRKSRAQRRAATQAALLGQDPAEVLPNGSNIAGYAVAVLVLAAIVVVALVVLV